MADKYVMIFHDWPEATRMIGYQEKGRLIDAIVKYARGDNDWDDLLKGNEKYLFPMFQTQIDQYMKQHPGIAFGSRHWNWKGGITPENQKARSSKEYSEWRQSVFRRDDYTCCFCGKVGGVLNAHHIRPWATNPELRFDIDNGITLCELCHRIVHRKE